MRESSPRSLFFARALCYNEKRQAGAAALRCGKGAFALAVSTREQILIAARRRFNEEGYEQVTMRSLADGLHIGVGNVTYYFKRKQDIVAAIMDDSFMQMPLSDGDASPAQLTLLLSQMLDTLTCNAFFFLDPEFAQDERHARHHGQIRACLLASLEQMTRSGFFLPAFTPEIRETLLSLLLMTHITWLRQTMRSPSPSMSKAALLRAHWLVLSPYLSDAGQQAYAQIKDRPPLCDA